MTLKVITIFSGMVLVQMAFYGIFFYMLGCAESKIVFGFNFSSIWSFLAVLVLFLVPLIYLLNYSVLACYYHAYIWFTQGTKIWPVQMLFWASGPFAFVILSYFGKGELPSKGVVVGLIFYFMGALISNVYK